MRAQRLLMENELRILRLALVAGFPMGAQQAYQWAVSYPDSVGRIVAWCGHAHTTPHIFLAQAETWKAHNVGATRSFEGDYRKALASIRARVLVMPCVTDTYFPADDARMCSWTGSLAC